MFCLIRLHILTLRTSSGLSFKSRLRHCLEETTHPTFTYLRHTLREVLTSTSLTSWRRAIQLRMASKLSPRGWWANLLGNGTRPCFLSSLPSLLLIWCLFCFMDWFLFGTPDDHYPDRSSPSSLFSPFLPYLPSVHSSFTAHERPVQHVSNAHLKTSSATYLVGCGMAHSGKRTAALDTVQWTLNHRHSFQRQSKA